MTTKTSVYPHTYAITDDSRFTLTIATYPHVRADLSQGYIHDVTVENLEARNNIILATRITTDAHGERANFETMPDYPAYRNSMSWLGTDTALEWARHDYPLGWIQDLNDRIADMCHMIVWQANHPGEESDDWAAASDALYQLLFTHWAEISDFATDLCYAEDYFAHDHRLA